MKLTTKLLIITLLALSFFIAEPKDILQIDTCFTVAEEENPNYEQINNNDPYRPHSLDTTTSM